MVGDSRPKKMPASSAALILGRAIGSCHAPVAIEPARRQSGALQSALQPCEALQRERRRCQLAGHRQRDRELLVVAARREVDDLPLACDVCWEVDNGEPLLNEAARRC